MVLFDTEWYTLIQNGTVWSRIVQFDTEYRMIQFDTEYRMVQFGMEYQKILLEGAS